MSSWNLEWLADPSELDAAGFWRTCEARNWPNEKPGPGLPMCDVYRRDHIFNAADYEVRKLRPLRAALAAITHTSAALAHTPSSEAVSTGNADLDGMLGLNGYYRGPSILISGLAGATYVSADPADAVVLVTARLPNEALGQSLTARRGEWREAGLASVTAIGDALAPSTIAAAVYAGRRYAEEFEAPAIGDAVPFRREITGLTPL